MRMRMRRIMWRLCTRRTDLLTRQIFIVVSYPQEFEYWLKRNPKVLDSLLSFKTKEKECTLGPLIMSPSEQQFSVSESQQLQQPGKGQGQAGTSVEVVTRRAAASPTLFQIGGPSLEGEDEGETQHVQQPANHVGDNI